MLSKIPFLNDYCLEKDCIDIWEIPLKTLSTHLPLEILSEEEQIRANRFYFYRHQRRFTITHVISRLILAKYIKQEPKQLIFTTNNYGKPTLINEQNLEFNLSHSKDVALLAIGKDYPLGIDLEFFSARPYEGIAKHLFSLKEQDQLTKLPSYLKPFGFFNIWSQKEAFIKACGMGLSYPTQAFDVNIWPCAHNTIEDPLYQQQWKMLTFMPYLGCHAALCSHPRIRKIRYVYNNVDNLLNFL